MNYFENPLHLALFLLWAFLAAASLIIFILVKLKPNNDFKELVERTQSWWVIIAIFSLALLSSEKISLILLAFISFLALKEYFSLIPTRRVDRPVLFWAYASIPLQFYFVSIGWYGLFIIFIPIYMFLGIILMMTLLQKTEGFLKSSAAIHWGLMTCVFSLSHAAFLLVLPEKETDFAPVTGAGLLFFLIALTQLNDVAQYVWGKSFGKHKILPVVSPKKTWQGLIGGVITTVFISVLIAPYLTPFDLTSSILIGFIIGIFGFAGDVSISAVKRDLGVKDFSSMIPGHGGVMDRVDSLTFTAPLFFHFVWYFYY
jgi:phosphatidate cytidylyltransferase